ncbi:uncharacterized protein LODBEIA_P01380 [Lodderomyces beijingensis]|uniref:Acyl-CoA thioesterase-like N-terminal HotDog domain-containing protein n=1 Tax=Lodderomyces beijingensis TaxID=1775926 RepID=A0ABP0ZDE8_9ASCO
MDRLKSEVYNKENPVAKIEAKAAAWIKGARGSYGGDFLAQGSNACWESVGRDNFQPHSLHSYFVKAIQAESNLRWEVLKISDSRSFANRLAMAYQNDKLCFTLQVSFTKDNDLAKREKPTFKNWWPPESRSSLSPSTLEESPANGFTSLRTWLKSNSCTSTPTATLSISIPSHIFKDTKNFDQNKIAEQESGMFVKVLDNYDLGRDKFPNMGNDRLLTIINFYTMKGTIVATAIQEAYGVLTRQMVERSRALLAKYHPPAETQQSAKL